MAVCWAARGWRAEVLAEMVERSWVVRDWDIAERRASFSGFGGIGGGGRLADWVGSGGSNGEVSKSRVGFLCSGCGGGCDCCGY